MAKTIPLECWSDDNLLKSFTVAKGKKDLSDWIEKAVENEKSPAGKNFFSNIKKGRFRNPDVIEEHFGGHKPFFFESGTQDLAQKLIAQHHILSEHFKKHAKEETGDTKYNMEGLADSHKKNSEALANFNTGGPVHQGHYKAAMENTIKPLPEYRNKPPKDSKYLRSYIDTAKELASKAPKEPSSSASTAPEKTEKSFNGVRDLSDWIEKAVENEKSPVAESKEAEGKGKAYHFMFGDKPSDKLRNLAQHHILSHSSPKDHKEHKEKYEEGLKNLKPDEFLHEGHYAEAKKAGLNSPGISKEYAKTADSLAEHTSFIHHSRARNSDPKHIKANLTSANQYMDRAQHETGSKKELLTQLAHDHKHLHEIGLGLHPKKGAYYAQLRESDAKVKAPRAAAYKDTFSSAESPKAPSSVEPSEKTEKSIPMKRTNEELIKALSTRMLPPTRRETYDVMRSALGVVKPQDSLLFPVTEISLEDYRNQCMGNHKEPDYVTKSIGCEECKTCGRVFSKSFNECPSCTISKSNMCKSCGSKMHKSKDGYLSCSKCAGQ